MQVADLDIGLRIRLARVTQRMTQRDLSRLTGIPPSVISDIENGWRTPTAEQVAALFAALGVEPPALRTER